MESLLCPPAERKKMHASEKHMRPFVLDIHMTRRYVTATVTHRVSMQAVAVASSLSADIRRQLHPSQAFNTSVSLCAAVGEALAQRCTDVDVFAVIFRAKPSTDEQMATIVLDALNKRGIIVDALLDHG